MYMSSWHHEPAEMCRWTEAFRFRVQDAGESMPQIHLTVRDGSGKGLGVGGTTIGRAVLDTAVIVHELERMRKQQTSAGMQNH